MPTNPIAAKELQRKGVRRGVPDMLLVVGARLFFIEMKKTEGGVLSKQQGDWITAIKLCGVEAYRCDGFKAAQRVVMAVMQEQGVSV